MNFGKSIFVAFVLFAVFMATLVTVCVNQNISLVSRNYYQEELKHQTKIDQINNTAALSNKPTIEINEGVIRVFYSDFDQLETGKLALFRPSDASLDKQFTLSASHQDSIQLALPHWKTGLYRVTMTWRVAGKDYYLDKVMVL